MDKPSKNNNKSAGARLRRVRKPGDVATLQRKLWQAVIAAEDLLLKDGVLFEEQIRAIHALTQAAQAYGNLLQKSDFAERMKAIEERLEQQQPSNLRRLPTAA